MEIFAANQTKAFYCMITLHHYPNLRLNNPISNIKKMINIINKKLSKYGFSIIRNVFEEKEINVINERIQKHIQSENVGIIRELDKKAIRAIHGIHLFDTFFDKLSADPRILKQAVSYLKKPCYIHQTKINMKAKKVGERWPWHQDYIYWKKEDGLLKPNLLNVAILLSPVTMQNGPICLIPKSHKLGCMTNILNDKISGWNGNVSVELTYQIESDMATQLMENNPVTHFVGMPGDVMFFDPMTIHGSEINNSDMNRNIFLLTYNAIDNLPTVKKDKLRPDFLCSRKHFPLETSDQFNILDWNK